jgi:hypothetical protein
MLVLHGRLFIDYQNLSQLYGRCLTLPNMDADYAT